MRKQYCVVADHAEFSEIFTKSAFDMTREEMAEFARSIIRERETPSFFTIYLDGARVASFGAALRKEAESELARLQALCVGTSSQPILKTVTGEH